MKNIKLIGAIIIALSVGVSLWAGNSKYDTAVSKYDIGYNSFRYKFDEASNRCIETALKEREAILADIKSGRFQMKSHPDYTDAIFVSNDFSREKEYLYFGSTMTCVKYNKVQMVNNINRGGNYGY